MPRPISIDLRDLTTAKVKRALPHMGECSYHSPCIIGTLLTPKQRERIDGLCYEGPVDIISLVAAGLVRMPEEQRTDAGNIQSYFDDRNERNFLSLVQKWVDAKKED